MPAPLQCQNPTPTHHGLQCLPRRKTLSSGTLWHAVDWAMLVWCHLFSPVVQTLLIMMPFTEKCCGSSLSSYPTYTTFLNCSPLLYQYIVSLICYHWKEIKQWFSYKISYNVQYTLSVFLHFLPQLSYSTFTFYKLSQNTHWHSKSPCQNSWTWVCMNLLSFLFCFAAHILTAIKNRHGYDWLENCVMDGCTPQVSRELERILHSIFFWNISF